MSKWLFAVTRNRKSRFTQKFFKTKSASCPRCRKVVGQLQIFHGDELSKKSTVTHVNFLPRFVNGNLSQSAWPATFVFMQAAVFEATTSSRGQTKLQKLNYKPTPKPAACINMLLQARARQPHIYFVTKQSTVTGCHLQSR